MIKIFILILIIVLIFIIIDNFCMENFTETKINDIDYYVIHMEKNKERIPNINENQNKLNQEIKIFDAVVGKNVDLNNLAIYDINLKNNFNYTYIGEIGCYLSHLMLIKLINKNTGYTVIFEDDFKILSDDLHSDIIHNLDIIDNNFDILVLGNLNNNHSSLYKENIYTIDYFEFLWGTHAYVINNKNAKKIYNALLNMDAAIDNKYKKLFDDKILNSYVLYPILVDQKREEYKSAIR